MGLHADFGQQAADRRTGAALALLRPPFAWNGYANSIPNTGPGGNGRFLTPLELLDRFAALVPTSCIYHHRYFGAVARTTARGKFAR